MKNLKIFTWVVSLGLGLLLLFWIRFAQSGLFICLFGRIRILLLGLFFSVFINIFSVCLIIYIFLGGIVCVCATVKHAMFTLQNPSSLSNFELFPELGLFVLQLVLFLLIFIRSPLNRAIRP